METTIINHNREEVVVNTKPRQIQTLEEIEEIEEESTKKCVDHVTKFKNSIKHRETKETDPQADSKRLVLVNKRLNRE
jgi:hypothetical protein